jgi:hypothetical protein
MPVTHIIDRLKRLTGQAQCLKLHYSDGERAIKALEERFGR